MNDGGAERSARARMRAAARERREARARERGEILDLVVSGYTYEAIADSLKLSVKSVRRAAAKAIEQRQLDCGALYVHLQVLRLTKAMRVVDLNLEEGEGGRADAEGDRPARQISCAEPARARAAAARAAPPAAGARRARRDRDRDGKRRPND
jgi:hypothetical protein